MKNLALYRAMLACLPPKKWRFQALLNDTLSNEDIGRFQSALRKHRALGGALAFFDESGLSDHFVYGDLRPGQPVSTDTVFRLASLSKTVTAAGVLALSQMGLVDLERDADLDLPYSLRHPKAKDRAITLKMLLSHTAGIRDGQAYEKGLVTGALAGDILAADSHTEHLPGEGCAYSNFGFGLIPCAVEAQTGLSFQTAMQKALFDPLHMKAAYYPGLLQSPLANSRRILPPRRSPNFDGEKRRSSLNPDWDKADVSRHYALAQGACCTDVDGLVKLGLALMKPGFFTEDSLLMMTRPHASLKDRDPFLTQGLGIFILKDEAISTHALVGHQGMAYGAVQLFFIDLQRRRGLISLTTGASEAREYILTDLNRALLSLWQKHD